jgi:DHA1 family bicyclomycin/chloramphenicol resistance-like MFS transporter
MTMLMAGSSITALIVFLWLRKGAEYTSSP